MNFCFFKYIKRKKKHDFVENKIEKEFNIYILTKS